MIDWIFGKICEKEPTKVILEYKGIAFSIRIPLSTYEALGELGEEVKIFIHPVFKNVGAQNFEPLLFGFKTIEERDFFSDLLLVPGIGPQNALRVVSSTKFSEFKRAVFNEDIETISSIKGISQRRASKLIFELKEKYKKEELPESLESNAIGALIGLGIPAKKARELVSKVEASTIEDLIKEALRRL